jgi:UDP-glucose 4-epimerase
VVRGNLLALEAKGLSGQVVNVATGSRTTLRTLLAVLAKLTGRPARARRAPARAGDIRHSHAEVRAARRLLGYRPIVDLETGLRVTVDWYRENPGAGRPRRRSRRKK